MKRNKDYFSHDFDAAHDRLMAGLILDYRGQGYGIYWVVVEMMHMEGGFIIFDDDTCRAIVKVLNEEHVVVKRVIEDLLDKYKLFFRAEDNPELISSNRVLKNLLTYEDLVEKRRSAGRASGAARRGEIAEQTGTHVQQTGTNGNKGQQTKLNKTKLNKTKLNKTKDIAIERKLEFELKSNPDPALTGPEIRGTVCYDAEAMILEDQIFLEAQAMKNNFSMESVKSELTKFHLHQSQTERYPMGTKAAKSGFQLWLIRSGDFKKIDNGKSNKNSRSYKGFVDPEKDGSKP